jgi:hypothetical protein
MRKKTLFEFQEAVTNRAAKELAAEPFGASSIYEKLLPLLEERRWPVEQMILTSEGQTLLSQMGELAQAKTIILREVDQQR